MCGKMQVMLLTLDTQIFPESCGYPQFSSILIIHYCHHPAGFSHGNLRNLHFELRQLDAQADRSGSGSGEVFGNLNNDIGNII